MQSGVTVSGNNITGTLIKQTSGQIVTDWGQGYFIGLKFTPDSDATVTKVGLVPTAGSGMVALDSDNLAMFKLTDITTQKLRVVSSRPGEEKMWEFDLSGLTLSDE
jgi:hypothetical protein